MLGESRELDIGRRTTCVICSCFLTSSGAATARPDIFVTMASGACMQWNNQNSEL